MYVYELLGRERGWDVGMEGMGWWGLVLEGVGLWKAMWGWVVGGNVEMGTGGMAMDRFVGRVWDEVCF